jgi:hypothetical protein
MCLLHFYSVGTDANATNKMLLSQCKYSFLESTFVLTNKIYIMSFLASRVAAASVRALGSTLIVGCWLQHEKDRHARCETISQSPASSLEHTMQTIAGNPTYEAPNGKKTDNLFYNDGDSFPNLSRHGSNSLLKKYLTPDVYEQLKDKQTSAGVKLEDLIQGGIALPWGARPPRGIAGVYAGDAGTCLLFLIYTYGIVVSHSFRKSQNKTIYFFE